MNREMFMSLFFFFYVMESLKKSPIVNNLLKLQYSKDVIYRTAI